MDSVTILKYLKYILFSSNRKGHGVHSPFVFHLISEVFRNKSLSGVVLDLEAIRKEMISDQKLINVKDLGAGSKYKKGSLRTISEIAKRASVPRKYGNLLCNLAREFGGKHIVELGTSLGISTMYLSRGASTSTIHTVEGCPRLSAIARENFLKSGCSNVVSYTGHFDDVITEFAERKIIPGLVFIDGDHRKDSVIRYFSKMADLGDERTVIVIDDIHTSKEMGEAWDSIRKYPGVSLTVDIFRMGLAFFVKGLMPSDYIIRY